MNHHCPCCREKRDAFWQVVILLLAVVVLAFLIATPVLDWIDKL